MPKQKTNNRLEEIASQLDRLEAEHKAQVNDWKNQKDTYQQEAEDLLQKAAAEDKGHTDKVIAFESSAETAKRRAELAAEKIAALEAENLISYDEYKTYEASVLEEMKAAEEALKEVIAEAQKMLLDAASAAAEVYGLGNDILNRMYKTDYKSGPTIIQHKTERRFKCTRDFPTIVGHYYDAPVTREYRQRKQQSSRVISIVGSAIDDLGRVMDAQKKNYVGILNEQQKVRYT